MAKPDPDLPQFVPALIEVKLGLRGSRFRRAAHAICCTRCGLIVGDETIHATACAGKKVTPGG